jgi:hypothetical protein
LREFFIKKVKKMRKNPEKEGFFGDRGWRSPYFVARSRFLWPGPMEGAKPTLLLVEVASYTILAL